MENGGKTTNGSSKATAGKTPASLDQLLKSLGTVQLLEKKYQTVEREKDHLQKEYNKCILMKDKLEQVCREQQKLMKSIKNESTTRIREEEEKRKETQAHFQKSINEIFATLGKNNDENVKLKEANLEMTKKFKYLAEQYELREKQLGKINEQIELESKLNEAKIAKAKMEATIEKEILLKEKESVLVELLSTKKSITDMHEREKILKEQLNMYTEKYADFQTSLQKSNDVFSTYKNEIEKMSKRNKILEKEGFEWRNKYEKCNRALLDMVGDKQAQDAYVGKSSRQIAQLQKLCRTLQAERTVFIEVLAANNIERPAMPELPPLPTDIEPPPKSADKLDIMSRNCLELKKSLAQLQTQMNTLSVEKPSAPKKEEAVAAKKNNKKRPNKKPAKDRNAVAKTIENELDGTSVQSEINAESVPESAPKTADTLPEKPPTDLIVEAEPVAEPTEDAIAVVVPLAIETTAV